MISIIRAWLHLVEPASLSGLASASVTGLDAFDSTLTAITAGAAGNSIAVILLADADPPAVEQAGDVLIVTFTPTVSTVADIEALIDAAGLLVYVSAPGTGATVLDAGAAVVLYLSDGADAVLARYPLVVPVDAVGPPRPPLPYYVAAWGPSRSVGATDEQHDGVTKGVRAMTVTVTGYGDGVDAFLEQALLALSDDDVLDAVHAAGGSIDQAGPVIRTSAMRDTDIEAAYAVDVFVTYKVDRTGADVIEVLRIEAAVTLDGDLSSTVVWEA